MLFDQIVEDCVVYSVDLMYCCFGVSCLLNMFVLFECVDVLYVYYVEDIDVQEWCFDVCMVDFDVWLVDVDYVYLIIDMDVLVVVVVLGVFVFVVYGIMLLVFEVFVQYVCVIGKVCVVDIVEINFEYDQDCCIVCVVVCLVYYLLCCL